MLLSRGLAAGEKEACISMCVCACLGQKGDATGLRVNEGSMSQGDRIEQAADEKRFSSSNT